MQYWLDSCSPWGFVFFFSVDLGLDFEILVQLLLGVFLPSLLWCRVCLSERTAISLFCFLNSSCSEHLSQEPMLVTV